MLTPDLDTPVKTSKDDTIKVKIEEWCELSLVEQIAVDKN